MLNLIPFLIPVFIVYLALLTIYRLFFHPLLSYPGPKLTAATFWVECYHDVFRRGQFLFKIQEWHQKYGPIIRINPDELHIDDFAFSETLYGRPGSKRNKYEPWCRLAGSMGSAFATPGHDLHRSRRKAVSNFFSKSAITKIEPLIRQNVKKLEHKFERAMRNEEVLNLNLEYFALSMDVVAQYAFDDQESLLDDDALTQRWHKTIHAGFESGAVSRHFPWVFPIVNALPVGLAVMLSKPMGLMLRWRDRGRERVKVILDQKGSAKRADGYKTVFHEIRDSDLPASEKSVNRLVDEAQVFIGAGSDTTARLLSVCTYYLLANKEYTRRLQHELIATQQTDEGMEWAKLEQLPYLEGLHLQSYELLLIMPQLAVVSEGLRLSYGVTTRLPRVAVDETFSYNGKPIPDGTPVGMTQYLTMMNTSIFPEPKEFKPERWLNADGSYNHSMNKFVLSFGKGSRQCLGMNLAYAEIYITLSRIFGRFHLELYETTRDDIEIAHDFFAAAPKDGSKGVRVCVKELLADS